MTQPTLQQLSYLVALADEGHFGRAAARCHVSQPALSTQVQEVERRLGVTLVERTPRQARLTPAGAEVVRRARILLRDVADLEAAATGLQGELVGTVHLGVIPTMAPYVLPSFVTVVANRFPEVQLQLREGRTHEIVDELRHGSLDLLLLAVPFEHDAGVTTLPLATDPFLLAMSDRHPLAAQRGKVPLSLLADLDVLLLEDGHCLRTQALDVCALAGAAPRTVHHTSLASLVQLVAAGRSVTLLPASAAALEARPGNGITTRSFEGPPPSRTIGLAWRDTAPNPAPYRELGRLLRPRLG
jgi:LysR family hydrogen peroxide-inducible transcriptional activator